MVGLVVIVMLIARYRRRGHGWLAAILKGVSTYLLGVIAIYGIAFLLIASGFVTSVMNPAANAVLGIFIPSSPPKSRAPSSTVLLPTMKQTATSTPGKQGIATDIEARVTAVAFPTATPVTGSTGLSPGRTPTPRPAQSDLRVGCDQAYPELRTCIPPGPPFDQGCGITEERLFAVLPPDPQHLDADGDGVGCEPMN